MSFLAGGFTVTLDKQGRFFIPGKLRCLLPSGEEKLMFTVGVEKCIQGYNIQEWDAFIKKNIQNKDDDPELYRWLQREFLGNSCELAVDAQFRITLPKDLMEWANITDLEEVRIMGLGDHVEIWNPEIYKTDRNAKAGAIVSAMNRPKDDAGVKKSEQNPNDGGAGQASKAA
jgi:division/cell wall cluster transcriptional repressor MraZ